MRAPLALVLLFAVRIAAGQAYLVKDLATSPAPAQGSTPFLFTEAGGTVYFTANTLEYGTELWKTDGTQNGTSLVADLRSGQAGSYPRALTPFGTSLLFIADDDAGTWLWITRGTAATTTRIATAAASRSELVIVNGRIFFSGHDAAHGDDVFASDGTPAGTHVVLDMAPDYYFPETLRRFGDRIAFFFGTSLWITDGTASGTQRVYDGLVVRDMIAAGNLLFVRAYVQSTGTDQLFVSDGTPAGTRMIKIRERDSPFPQYVLQRLTPLDNRVFFIADDGVHGAGPWVCDGSAAQQLAAGIPMDTGRTMTMVPLNGIMYMALGDYSHGQDLWRSDGTPGGTYRVDLPAGAAGNVFDINSLLGSLWINAKGLWRSDGTAAGTLQVTDAGGVPGAALNGRVFFDGYTPQYGFELWSSDGTAAGTSMLANIQPEIAASSNPVFAAAAGNHLFFLPTNPLGDLWATDGTENGTVRIAQAKDVKSTVEYRGSAYYLTTGGNLWRTDVESSGPVFIVHFDPPADTLFVAGGVLYISSPVYPGRLWRSDGTAPGTVLLANTSIYRPNEFIGRLLIGGNIETDGGRPPHVLFNPRPDYFYAAKTWIGGGTIYMLEVSGNQLNFWKSNGTQTDTKLVKSFTGAKLWTGDYQFATFSAVAATTTQLFFALDDGTHGWELWRTDGTTAGTYMVKDILPGSGPSSPSNFAVLDDKLLFTADDGVFGRELWISDGTEAGTHMVKDIAPLGASSTMKDRVWNDTAYLTPNILVANGVAWFAANDGIHGIELWRSDGTAAGTYLAADVESGPLSSWPEPMAVAGNTLYFAATTAANGRELWALPVAPATTISLSDVRAIESTQSARLVATLSSPATEAVTASWSADNGAAGNITIPAGQMSAEIVVPFAADGVPAGNRVLYVRLRDIRGAIGARSVGAVLIEDTDIRADLAVTISLAGDGRATANVTNLGPSDAADVRLQIVAGDASSQQDLGVMKAGVTKQVPVTTFNSAGGMRVSALASEYDPDLSNNVATMQVTVGPTLVRLAANPAWLTVGARGKLSILRDPGGTIGLTSSNPEIIAVPASVTAPTEIEITGLAPGTATITASDAGVDESLQISVVAPGQTVRWPSHLGLTIGFTSFYYGSPRVLTATARSISLDVVRRPTGSVTFSTGGHVLATALLDAYGTATATVDNLLPGQHEIVVSYAGDAHFLPDSASTVASVNPGPPSGVAAILRLDAPKRGALTIAVTGFGGIAPTGKVTVTQGETTLIDGAALDPDGTVTRELTIDQPAGNVTVKYFGDSLYQPVTKSVPIVRGRAHTAR